MADEYPSWSDVEAVRGNEVAKRDRVTEIAALINGLDAEVAASDQLANDRAAAYEAAQLAYDEKTFRAAVLAAQAEQATREAEESRERAGKLVSSWLRSGGVDLSTTLVLGSDASDLLSQLATISKLTERTNRTYERARVDLAAAAALTTQARVAQQALAELQADAEQSLQEAIEARAAAQNSLAQQQEHAVTLNAQLAVLQENREATEADYRKGESARVAATAAAAAAVAAAAHPSTTSEPASGSGWTRPISGWITDSFGPRPGLPVPGVNPFHSGTDIAAGCGRSVHAASAGTVEYAGWLGSYGNWVLIDHGNGVKTGYAHNSELLVGNGQEVAAGTTIALVGTTGASTGCHVHFEVRVDGARVDAESFMAARGAPLG
ncbi:peptidoglycan DD-metalloendopeptidase family protein [Plantibacter sp. YIM 135249]|uniref:M23 family metallopeptidase n=1 Tax=Plantibacter sp. YIM 135249 TaxID=3423918 RepID=UPI003D34643B